MSDPILIIKTGAAGDVVRTSCLLNKLQGEIYWVTSARNARLLPTDMPNLHIIPAEEARQKLANQTFSLIVSLEEDEQSALLAATLDSSQLTGVYVSGDKIDYTEDSSSWYDMSRISRLGMERANELKMANRKSFQQHLFGMLGMEFNGEPYRIWRDETVKTQKGLIGLEKRSGDRWPNKQWWGYDELVLILEKMGMKCRFFEQKPDIRGYLRTIDECERIVSGDTLAMHVGMAYGKPGVAIFNCTSPDEIYEYGLLRKVVNPLLKKNFYSTSFDEEVVKAVAVEEVLEALVACGLRFEV